MKFRILTNSERSAFACRRLWWFSYVEGLTSDDTPAALRQGSLVHRGVDAWSRSGMTLTGAEVVAAVVDPWLEARMEWASGRDDSAEKNAADQEIADEAGGMLRHYIEHYAADQELWEVVAVEAQMARELFHPVTGRPIVSVTARPGKPRWRRQWTYGGRIDRLMRHRRNGGYWLFETKTTAQSNLDAYCRKLHFDPQIRGYAWALEKPAPMSDESVRAGVKIEGVVYDVLRKAVPAVPKMLAPPKATKKEPHPVSPGLSRDKRILTTRAVYLAEVLRQGLHPDDYADILATVDAQRFFHREAYTFTDQELVDFERDVSWSALEMLAAEKATYQPRQVSVCSSARGFGCPRGFESICLEDGPMSRQSFLVRTIRHAELDGDLAEPGAFGVAAGTRAAPDGFAEEPVRSTPNLLRRRKTTEPETDSQTTTPTTDEPDLNELAAPEPAADEDPGDPFGPGVDG